MRRLREKKEEERKKKSRKEGRIELSGLKENFLFYRNQDK